MTLASEWSTIRDSAVTLLQGIAGIGNVYGYLRYLPKSDEFLTAMQATVGATDYIRAWVVTLEDLDVDQSSMDTSDVTTSIRVDGWLSLVDADATEQIFIDLCQQVVVALTNEETFGSSIVLNTGRTRLRGPEIVTFGGTYTCHHATITQELLLDQALVWT